MRTDDRFRCSVVHHLRAVCAGVTGVGIIYSAVLDIAKHNKKGYSSKIKPSVRRCIRAFRFIIKLIAMMVGWIVRTFFVAAMILIA